MALVPIVGNGPYAASLAPPASTRRLEPQIRPWSLKGRYGALQPRYGLSVALWRQIGSMSSYIGGDEAGFGR